MKKHNYIFVGLLCTAATAHSQTEPEKASSTSASRTLEEVVVTATKRAKSERDVSISLDAFSGQDLEESGATGFEDYIKLSPGVTMNSGMGPEQSAVTIRGINTGSNTSVVGSFPTGIFLEDIPLSNPSIRGTRVNLDPFDLATVEILKGPQGTLFGGSALAGAVRFMPNNPNFEEFEAKYLVSATRPEHSKETGISYGLAINVPLGESLALRVSGVHREWPGWIDDYRRGESDVDSSYNEVAHAMLAWEPTERLRFRLSHHIAKAVADDIPFVDNFARPERQTTNDASPVETETPISIFKLGYSFDFATLDVILARRDNESFSELEGDRLFGTHRTNRNLIDVLSDRESVIDTIEVRAASNEPTQSEFWIFDNWDWMIGYFSMEADQSQIQTVAIDNSLPLDPSELPLNDIVALFNAEGAFPGTVSPTQALAIEDAIFLEVTRGLFNNALELNLGARFFEQSTEFFAGGTVTNQELAFPNTGADAPTDPKSGKQEESGTNPKVSLTWHYNDDFRVTASAVKGFRFGGVNDLIPVLSQAAEVPPFYDSDELWNYEVIIRTDWLDKRLTVDLTGFQIDWERLQISQRGSDGITAYVDNVGAATSEGAELEIRALLPWGLYATLAGSYNDAYITEDFESARGPIPAGRALPAAAKWQYAVQIAHSFQINNWTLKSGITYSYQDESYSDLQKDHRLEEYSLTDLNFSVSNVALPWFPNVSLLVKNVFDKRGVSNADSSIGTDSEYLDVYFVQPRTMVLQLTGSF